MRAEGEPIGIYVHIPFCIRKCNYCDFLSFVASEDLQDSYVNSLCKQIDGTVCDRTVSSVYFGGGTPTVLPPDKLGRLTERLRSRFSMQEDAEITLECNPLTADYKALLDYRALGFNRLSLGMQSMDDTELALLGRIHTAQDFLHCYEGARRAGFENVNIDLMTALPRQTNEKLLKTLTAVIALQPEHISAYSLILEEGTPFYERYAKGEWADDLPGEEGERALYGLTRDLLLQNGYLHYEISNFSLPGYESRHNLSYWNRQDYLGFGLGASGLLRNVRTRNIDVMEAYLQNPFQTMEAQVLSEKDCMEEFMFLGLRKRKGISVSAFQRQFRQPLRAVYGEVVRKLIRDGLLREAGDFLFLTDRGIDYGNYVFSRFLF